MQFRNAIALLALTLSTTTYCTAFIMSSPPSCGSFAFVGDKRILMTRMFSSSDENNEDEGEGVVPNSSQFLGNRRAATPREIAIMDEMITKLASAAPTELPNAVSKAIRVVSSPQFFLRIAQRADMETDDESKEKLALLASNVSRTLEAVVSTTENKLDERSEVVEQVVKVAAEPDSGEFLWPLTVERCDAIQEEMRKLDPGLLDESFLLTVDAWMNKSMQDGMDGMVGILQKVLQAYAGTAVSRARSALKAQVGAAVTGKSNEEAEAIIEASDKTPNPASHVLERLLAMDTERWDSEVRKVFNTNEVTSAALVKELQGTMEGVVLGLENGSMTQQVQAEYLRELMTRIENVSE